MFWNKAVAAALLCALLLAGCGAADNTRQPGQTVAVITERSLPPETHSLPGKDPGEVGMQTYILNRGSVKFHRPTCAWAAKISDENRIEWTGDRETLIEVGYSPCAVCKP